MRIGIDLGGTKIEALALADDGRELERLRIMTPRGDYDGTLAAITGLVTHLERTLGTTGSVGIGIPGSLRASDDPAARHGVVKNANSLWLNGRALRDDLERLMGREVRVANDANCLAVSEATDGAAAGASMVFAVILGTGCGGGVAVNGQLHAGPNGVAGEWGHSPLPWPTPDETPGPSCYCGRRGCIEQWVAGPAISRDYLKHVPGAPPEITTHQLSMLAQGGDPGASAAFDRLIDRLARSLTTLVHVLDPDVIVIGGGVSRVERLYAELPAAVRGYTFGGDFNTPLRPAVHGDSSGVRGAAWLWPATT